MTYHARAVAAFAVAILTAATATACSGGDSHGSSSVATPASSPDSAAATYSPKALAHATAVTVSARTGALGKILVNDKGRTLYLFQADKSSKSTCTGACAQAWPPLTVKGKPTGDAGVQNKLLSTGPRSDGSKQVTYKGHPLYLFAGDTKKGQNNGQGLNNFGAKWYVLGTDGKQITSKPSEQPSSSATSKPSGNGY